MNYQKLTAICFGLLIIIGLSCGVAPSLAAETGTLENEIEQCLALEGEAALAGCDRAIEIDPSSAIAWYGRARALETLNRTPEATTADTRAQLLAQYYNCLSTVLGRRQEVANLLNDEERIAEIDRAISSGEVDGEPLNDEQKQRLQEIREQILALQQDASSLDAKTKNTLDQCRTRLQEILQERF
ncbi:hypothetical protein IQ249_20170 [Lusitaniella coriacea LEGE 07157]|uniref:Tetratricopeptide repeat protein n=1 Tax=Lusitaniella coriacea LEGE 07157 TaxID=945747 RepID=A0A8J7E407_9CYAN|nr:tetratricopeptide repeat protein [Lusitaniella coriacea]MBE9118214.1 hypothetical protein [Lusitaniella coriacea LEGE 07157]